jgi:hypothetical protein
MSNLTNLFIGLGVGLVATSAVFLYFAYFAKKKKRKKSGSALIIPPLRVHPLVWKGGGGVNASLRF